MDAGYQPLDLRTGHLHPIRDWRGTSISAAKAKALFCSAGFKHPLNLAFMSGGTSQGELSMVLSISACQSEEA